MGVGMVAIVPQEEKDEALEILGRHYESFEIGVVTREAGIRVENYGVRL